MLVLPGGKTAFIKQLETISGLIDAARSTDPGSVPAEIVMFVTAQQWGIIFRELMTDHRHTLPSDKLPTPANFKRLKIRSLTVANAGTDDQGAVNAANEEAARQCGFSWAREHFKSGNKPDVSGLVGYA